jgi:hypothetical protein
MRAQLSLLLLTVLVLSCPLYAEEVSQTAPEEKTEYADHTNFIGSGLRSVLVSGFTLTYARPLTDQLLIGTSLMHGWWSDNRDGGSLDTAQYYSEEANLQTTMIDINASYYFRDHGLKRWGFLVRGGVGHAHSKAKAGWKRYDRDPGFIIIGDDKRLLEEGGVSYEWGSTYARLGGYYQFVFGFSPTSRVGHVLEIGAGGVLFDSKRRLAYTKPNGHRYDHDIPNTIAMVEFTYVLAF